MSRKLLLSGLALFLALATGLWALTNYYRHLPEKLSQQETIVLGQSRLIPGSASALRVVVRDSRDASPLAGAEIDIVIKPEGGGAEIPLYTGRTDAGGSANISFNIPEDAPEKAILVVETRSKLGEERVERPVQIARDYRLLLTSDKPLYQPGQTIHLRALALNGFDLRPAAGEEIEFVVADGKGNKVFREKRQASQYGVAAVDFQLAAEVNTGPYKISASLGNSSSERTVTVEHYVLPKFDLQIETDKPFYLPGERVKGSLKAAYFYGKPVAGGEVTLEGYTFDVERSVQVTLQGQTDEEGNFEFEFDLPGYLAGSDLEGGLGRFYLQAAVADLTGHSEDETLSLPISGSSLVIEAIPEGGQFRPGVENILYVLTSYPDGSPAETQLNLSLYGSGELIEANTGPYGLAEIRLIPNSPYMGIYLQARDAQGHQAEREFYFEGEYAEETILLRPERPVYRVGETLSLTVLSSADEGTAYLDIVREGQTVSTRSLEIHDGRGEVAVDLTPDLFGTLELHAYKLLSSGSIVRDTRLVVVDHADELSISIQSNTPGNEGEGPVDLSTLTFHPGETVPMEIAVNDDTGAGAQAVLGLTVVDESLYALAEMDPGFARLYFLLEEELLKPKYDLHGYSLPELAYGGLEDDDGLKEAVEDSARASLAAAIPAGLNFSLNVNSHIENLQRVEKLQERYFSTLAKGLYGASLILGLAIFLLSALALWRRNLLGKGVTLTLGMLLLCLLVFSIWPQEVFRPGYGLSERIYSFLLGLERAPDELLALAFFAGLLGLLGLIVTAVREKDAWLGALLALLPFFFGALLVLVFASNQVSLSPEEGAIVLMLVAVTLVPMAFLLRTAGFALERRPFPVLAGLSFVLFMGVWMIPGLTYSSWGMRNAAGKMMDGGIMMEAIAEAPAMMRPIPTQTAGGGMDFASEEGATGNSASNPAGQPEPPRLRQYFPETMLWLPEAETDVNGRLRLEVTAADSITTWRVTALASSQDGRLGSLSTGLRVFQDFFIDPDLPTALTVGDEISIPVGVFNYLPERQTVRLELEESGWFELLDEPVKSIEIAANDINVVHFRIRAVDFGRQPLKITAWGTRMSDAILKEVRVFPNGKELTFSSSDRLQPGSVVKEVVNFPEVAIPGTQRLQVKIYPGILSQVVEGLEGMLRMPFGCFEQTSSTTYPNVLVMDYIKTTGQVSPEVQMKAEEYINLGYQRLLTFEVAGGGFSLFGDAPADRMLTAYGLQEFADMSQVHAVDPEVVRRSAEWLLGQQRPDGSWENDQGLVHESTWSNLENHRLPVTAYITWSLVQAGFVEDARTQAGIAYVRENAPAAEDPYVLALAANALVSADKAGGQGLSPSTTAVLERLAALAQRDGGAAFWQSGIATFMGGEGQTGSIETTALAALALLQADYEPELANAALTYLVQQKDSFGTWHSTQATVLSLKALLESVRLSGDESDAVVTISLNGGQTRTLQIGKENFDVVQMVSFEDVLPGAENLIEISIEGQGSLMYQVTGGYYLPWEELYRSPELADLKKALTIDLSYDRTELEVNDTLTVKVSAVMNQAGARAESAIIDLGLPPGFSLMAEDLQALVSYFNDVPSDYPGPKIERYELTGRQLIIYVTNLNAEQPLEFSYRLQARFPLVAQAPASSAYDYYNPDQAGLVGPQTLVVAP